MSYHHFTTKDRNKLEGFLQLGLRKIDIAKQLNFDRSSVYREIKRAAGESQRRYPDRTIRKYSSWAGDDAARRNRNFANQLHHRLIRKKDATLAIAIERCLKKHWSPEQIVGCLRKGYISVGGAYKKIRIAVQTIYDWIYEFRHDLCQYLRKNHNRRYRHTRGFYIRKRKRKTREAQKSIDERPEHINRRARYGHWEGDTVIGAGKNSGSIATFVERKAKYLIAFKIDASNPSLPRHNGITLERSSKFADGASTVLIRQIHTKYLKTLTLDNGPENTQANLIANNTGMDIYFAHPYHSWERGTNENTNGLLRQYFPKKMRFDNVTQADIDKAVSEINNRPRKQLNWLTPNQVMRRIGALKRIDDVAL